MAQAALKYAKSDEQLMTAEEYLRRPDDSDGTKYELVDGVLRAMAPASARHAAIMARTTTLLGNHLTGIGSSCGSLTGPTIKVRVRSEINRRCPDVGVTCSPITDRLEVDDPILLIEILSEHNKRDTFENVWAYTTIPTVQEIVIINSLGVEALLLRRQSDGSWPDEFVRIDEVDDLELASIDLTLPLKDYYAQSGLV